MKCRAFKTCYNCSKLKYFEIVSKPASIMYSRFSYKQKTIENFQESSALYQDALSDDSPVYENLHQLIVMSNTNSKEKNPSANIFHLSTSRWFNHLLSLRAQLVNLSTMPHEKPLNCLYIWMLSSKPKWLIMQFQLQHKRHNTPQTARLVNLTSSRHKTDFHQGKFLRTGLAH